MKDLLICFQLNEKLYRHKISDLLENSEHGFINGSVLSSAASVYFPVVFESESFFIQNLLSDWNIVCGADKITSKHEFAHGDYFQLSTKNRSYSFLVLDFNEMSLFMTPYRLFNNTNIFIGRSDESNIIVDINDNISRKHAAIRIDNMGKSFVEDLSRKSGVFVNGIKETTKELVCGNEIYVMGSSFIYLGDCLLVPRGVKTNGMQISENVSVLSPLSSVVPKDEYMRTPRIFKSLNENEIIIDPPTATQKSKPMPFILVAGPSMTMSLAMLASLGVSISNAVGGGSFSSVITGGIMALSMLLGALLWPSLLRSYNKCQEAANEKYRIDKYNAYLAEKESEIQKLFSRNSRIWNEYLYPLPSEQVRIITEKDKRLWERTPEDEDFLSLRLGAGENEFEVSIKAPAKKFTLDDDTLLTQAIQLSDKYKVMPNVPRILSLKQKLVVGMVGNVGNVIRGLVLSLITFHSYDDVKLVFIDNTADNNDINWAFNVPHVWSSDKQRRYVATTPGEVQSLLSYFDELISERELIIQKDIVRIPHFIFFIFDEKLIDNVPFKRYLLQTKNDFGISAVFVGDKYVNIPKECSAIVQNDGVTCGIYYKNENNNRLTSFVPDIITDTDTNNVLAGLSNISITIKKEAANIPARIGFLDLYHVGNINALNIAGRWDNNSSHKSLAAPIGIKAGDEVFSLDIHEKYHGCHGLVAGMTGSGKSEFLQAYILSMMISYSPNDVAFILVDFKGGDMARPFIRAPHLSATISNLSGSILYRALVSLEAEVKSRQKIFNQAASDLKIDKIDINSYQKYFKEGKLTLPLPHLIIVIDEFAQLKTQRPEFLTKLVDIAQVGRSLGIHLILATQKPTGVVDPQIWSNSRFKVCLKVLDKQDSIEMINRPDSALIKLPGRAYVQVGYDEVFEQIQSGYSGTDYIPTDNYISDDSITVKMVDWTGEPLRIAKDSVEADGNCRTQIEETIAAIRSIAEVKGLRAKTLWLPPLPDSMTLSDCCPCEYSFVTWDTYGAGQAVCGMLDIPETQEQRPFEIDLLKNGHIAVYGSSGSGKTTFIQSLVYVLTSKYSPEMLNIFAIDFDGTNLSNFALLPHCNGFISGNDEEAVSNVMDQISQIIENRRNIFTTDNCATYESYLRATGRKLPLILFVIDNYAAFREKCYREEDRLVQIISAAKACGIYLIITGNSKGAIYYKVSEQISTRIVFHMNDQTSYRDILNTSVPAEPDNVPGRGLTIIGKTAVQVQIAVPFDTQNESNRMEKINAIYKQMPKIEKAFIDKTKTLISAKTDTSKTENKKFASLPPVDTNAPRLAIGVSINDGSLQEYNIHSTSRIFIGNPNGDGIPLSILQELNDTSKFDTYIYGDYQKDVLGHFCSVFSIDEFVDSICSNVEASPLSNAVASKKTLVLVIQSFCELYDVISDESLELFIKFIKANPSGLLIIVADDFIRLNDYRDTDLFISLIRCNAGIIVGGNINDERASMLSNAFNDISLYLRRQALSDNQALAYIDAVACIVDLKGRESNA